MPVPGAYSPVTVMSIPSRTKSNHSSIGIRHLMAALALLSLAPASCGPAPSPPSLFVLPLRNTLALVSTSVTSWQPDAQLWFATWHPRDQDPPSASLSYWFISPSDRKYNVVDIDSRTGVDAEVWPWPHDEPLPEPIATETLNLESQEALDRLLDYARPAFAHRRGPYHLITHLDLHRADQFGGHGPVVWELELLFLDTTETVRIIIDDASGSLSFVSTDNDREQDIWFGQFASRRRLAPGERAVFPNACVARVDAIKPSLLFNSAAITIGPTQPTQTAPSQSFRAAVRGDSFDCNHFEFRVVHVSRSWVDLQAIPTSHTYAPSGTPIP